MMPSVKVSSSIVDMSAVTCCHLPRGSVNRKSQYLASLSLISFRTSLAVVMGYIPFVELVASMGVAPSYSTSGLDGVQTRSPGSDPDGFLDVGDENLSVADPPGLGGAADRLDGLLDHVFAEHNLDLHLGQKIDHIFGPPVEFGMPFLPPEALGFGDRDPLQPYLLERFFHLVELERLDDRLDFFHWHLASPPANGTCRPSRPCS